ncbi:MAG: hypothetical protein KDA49_08385 [Rhodospirillaceae bacterium]|nr:hypothetical protein [Rhodospirillaceae bacterium]MCA8932473.1 hypothetical protein [Rhodospirillaceae bacterium]
MSDITTTAIPRPAAGPAPNGRRAAAAARRLARPFTQAAGGLAGAWRAGRDWFAWVETDDLPMAFLPGHCLKLRYRDPATRSAGQDHAR